MAKYLILGAWPYAYSMMHLGNLVSFIPGDVISKYLRLSGHDVVYVSGSDEYGAKMEFGAIGRGITPKQLVDEMHEKLKKVFENYNLDFDNYSRTSGEFHKKFVQGFYKKCFENGYIITKTEKALFCKNCNLFLADRFVEGICPICKSEGAQGNQCDKCQGTFEAYELESPKCCICSKSDTEIKETKQWYINLPKLEKKILSYVKKQKQWHDNVKRFSESWIKGGLKPRPITRDLRWGIPAVFPGSEGKVIYCWAEAVLGYISATAEKFPKTWKTYWMNPKCKQIYTQGKDNIVFHSILLPAFLMAEGSKYTLPWNISAGEFLNFSGEKFSKTKGIGIWADESLKILPESDYWRFYLMYNRPETKDADFSFDDFEARINNDLIANFGNFVNRTVTFTNVNFKSGARKPKVLKKEDKEILSLISKTLSKLEKIEEGFLKEPIREILLLSSEGNKYFQKNAPWELIKKDKKRCEEVLYMCLEISRALCLMFYPFIPNTAGKLWKMLMQKNKMSFSLLKKLPLKYKVSKPEILLQKIDKEELKKRLNEIRKDKSGKKDAVESASMKEKTLEVSYDEFSRLDLRTALIENVEDIKDSDKLYKIHLKIGEEKRIVCAGIKKYYKKEELLGKKIIIVYNLLPKNIKGIESRGMILAAEKENNVVLLTVDKEIDSGAKIY